MAEVTFRDRAQSVSGAARLANLGAPAGVLSEDQESDIEDAVKAAYRQMRNGQVGYEPRRELVRQAAKFMADLGAHPEVAETRKPDAFAALMVAGGLLHSFTLQQD